MAAGSHSARCFAVLLGEAVRMKRAMSIDFTYTGAQHWRDLFTDNQSLGASPEWQQRVELRCAVEARRPLSGAKQAFSVCSRKVSYAPVPDLHLSPIEGRGCKRRIPVNAREYHVLRSSDLFCDTSCIASPDTAAYAGLRRGFSEGTKNLKKAKTKLAHQLR